MPLSAIVVAAVGIFATSLVFSMFGRGGGEFYLPIMISLLPVTYYTAAGVNLFIIMLQGLSMLLVYHRRHRLVDWGVALLLGAVIGFSSFLGGYVSYRIPPRLLKLTFSGFLLASAPLLYRGLSVRAAPGGWGMWRRRAGGVEYYFNLVYVIPSVSLAAFTAGMAGISGGGLIIPICVLAGGMPIRVAMGTNTFLVLASSSMSFAGHVLKGGFDPTLGLAFGAAVILGSQIGSRLHARVGERRLRKGFSAILVAAALWMLLKALT